MSNRVRVTACWLVYSLAFAWVAACLDTPPAATANGDASDNEVSTSGGETGTHDDSSRDGPADGKVADASGEAGLGLLVDNMTAMNGTQISLPPPDGGGAGTYSAYSDYPASNYLGMMSVVTGTSSLTDTPVSPPITNPDGSQIVGELCFGRDTTNTPGAVLNYAGLNLNFAYGIPAGAPADAGYAAVPFDASHYSGVSFYIYVDPTDGPQPPLRFGVPDVQTADPSAWPTTDCLTQDAGLASDASDAGPPTNPCDDDFGTDLSVTPGTWTKVSVKWGEMAQQTWGAQFTGGIKPDRLIGMKWQANGAGPDAAVEPFRFCISDIYFTP